MLRSSILAAIGIILAPAALRGQGGPPAFEVASVKPAVPSPMGRGIYTYPGGRIAAYGYTLEKLIEEAFRVQPFQVSGGPRWIREDRYDVVAKPPESSKSSKSMPPYPKAPPNDEQRQMLQTLLQDRFRLQYHRETREGPVYLLVRTNKDLKLQDAKNKDDYPWAGSVGGGAFSGDGLAGINVSMEELARRLSPYLERLVLDQTGLTGSYDFKYEYHSGDAESDRIASILTSVQALGLKLEPGKSPVETWIVDRAERPAEN